MATNSDRFKKELDELISFGSKLGIAMYLDVLGKAEFKKKMFSKVSDSEADEAIKGIPDFKTEYDRWYSESIAIIKQLLPDRIVDFKSFYEKSKSRKQITAENYVIQDFLQGLSVTYAGGVKVDGSAAYLQFKQQLSILRAAKQRFTSALFEIRQLVQADLFDSEIEVARELARSKFFRAAGAVAGVILERHLHQVCIDHNVNITKSKPTLSVLNDALKNAGVIDVPQWRFNQHLGDIRNNCDHARTPDPTKDQVEDLLSRTAKILKTIS